MLSLGGALQSQTAFGTSAPFTVYNLTIVAMASPAWAGDGRRGGRGSPVGTTGTNGMALAGTVAARTAQLHLQHDLCQQHDRSGRQQLQRRFPTGHSLEFNPTTTCSASVNADPLLGPLANNGGPTRTMALGAGSPAMVMAT